MQDLLGRLASHRFVELVTSARVFDISLQSTSPPSRLHILIEKLEYIVFPRWNVLIEHAVAVVGSETDCGINLQKVWLVEAFQLISHGPPGGGAVIVLRVGST